MVNVEVVEDKQAQKGTNRQDRTVTICPPPPIYRYGHNVKKKNQAC